MVQLKEKNKDNLIPVSELKDGQIGVITQWSESRYLDIIVQRSNDFLFAVGGVENWGGIPESTDCRVRILREGTELIITNNQ